MATLIAVFDSPDTLDRALYALYDKGFSNDEVRVLRNLDAHGAPVMGGVTGEGVDRIIAPYLLTNRSDGLPPTSPSVPVATTSPLDGLDLEAEELERYAHLSGAGNGLLLIEASEEGLERARVVLSQQGASAVRQHERLLK